MSDRASIGGREGEPLACRGGESDESSLIQLIRSAHAALGECIHDQPTGKPARQRCQLTDPVWDQRWVCAAHLVDLHVEHLRRKLGDDPGSPRYVLTVRGIGYIGEGI